MSKYRVKNCPCNVTTEDICDWENTNETYCQDCTDCVMKQIVERCKDSMDYHSKDMYILGKTNMAGIVLALLQVEEVE